MSGAYVLLKWVHIVSSTVLFGMGAGIAFFFIRAQRAGDVRIIAAVGKDVVLADAIFTAAAVVTQPVTGLAMMWVAGYSWSLPWIWASVVLYLMIGFCWLPVVWLQIRMRDMAIAAAATGSELPTLYFKYYSRWFVLGWPAFIAVLIVFYLMVAKPAFPEVTQSFPPSGPCLALPTPALLNVCTVRFRKAPPRLALTSGASLPPMAQQGSALRGKACTCTFPRGPSRRSCSPAQVKSASPR